MAKKPKSKARRKRTTKRKRMEYRATPKRNPCPVLLRGPQTLNILEHKNGVRFILLGDEHVYSSDCGKTGCSGVFIDTFLEQVAKSYELQDSKVPLDIFIENEYALPDRVEFMSELKSREGSGESYISLVALKFAPCLRWNKRECSFKNIRFHNADIRNGVFQSTMTLDEKWEALKFRRLAHRLDHELPFSSEDLISFISLYAHDDPKPFLRMFKIDKQLKHLSKDLQDRLMTYIITEMHQRKEKFIANKETLRKTMKSDSVYNIFVDLFDFFLDVYVIARILRHDMRHVILYLGDWHRVNIQRFCMQYLGFDLVESRISNSIVTKQCINLTGVVDKFFQWN